ncbi:MAG: hypothetical protein DMF49_02245 [Acidobacteria bacterium]|nr:MAG: hypothetical protein DMF49_02245 [Acidobacteriota bacterium]
MSKIPEEPAGQKGPCRLGLPISFGLHFVLLGGLAMAGLLAVPAIEPPETLPTPVIELIFEDQESEGGGGETPETPPAVRRGEPEGSKAVARLQQEERTPERPQAATPENTFPVLDSHQEPTSSMFSSSLPPGTDVPFGDEQGDPFSSSSGVPGGLSGSGSGIGTGSGPGRGEGERAGTGEETREGSVSLPILLDKVDPVYPIMAIRSRIEGTVILEIVVGPDGSVREIYIRQSVPMLDAAAIEAIRQWRYAPARTGRRPVQSTVMVRVSFVLR